MSEGKGLRISGTLEYKEGETASFDEKTTRNNPYKIGSEGHWRWHEGFFGNDKSTL